MVRVETPVRSARSSIVTRREDSRSRRIDHWRMTSALRMSHGYHVWTRAGGFEQTGGSGSAAGADTRYELRGPEKIVRHASNPVNAAEKCELFASDVRCDPRILH